MIIHISQYAIKHNTNTGDNLPVITVHDDKGGISYHHTYDIPNGARIVYDQSGLLLDGSIIRCWIETEPGPTGYLGPLPRPECNCKGWGCFGCCDSDGEIRAKQGTYG